MRLARAAAHLGLAVVATFPLVLTPFSRLVGHEDVDVWNHAWGAWWFWRNLVDGTVPWRTELLFAPTGGVLWYIDPVGALLGLPFVPLLGVVGAYNAVVLAEVALASVAGRALARAMGASDAASWVGAAGVALSPYLLSEVHNGVSEAVGVPWAVFALAEGRRAVTEGGARRWAYAGGWLGLAALGTWYYALGAAVVLATWALLERRPGVLVAGAVSAALAAPVAWVVHLSVTLPDSLVFRGETTSADRDMLLSHNAVDPRALFLPGGFQSVDLAALGEAFRHSSYLGVVLLVLALASRRWVLLLGALPTLVLSLGPYLWWGGAWVTTAAGARLALPFRWLLLVLPDAAATHAQRVGFPAIAVVAALAAVGASRLKARVLPVALALVALDALVSAPWPLARAPALDLAAHAALAAAPGPGAVLDLPAEVDATMATSRYLVYQAASGRPIPYRPDARAGTASLLGVQAFQVLALPSLHRPEHREPLARMVAELGEIDLSVLVSRGVRWVVVHRELERGRQGLDRVEAQLVAWFGAPVVTGEHAVWETRAKRARVAKE